MPRNGSSVYSLPAGNPVIAGTVIATTWANSTLTDIATALTNSLSTDGSTASVSLAGKTMSGGTFSGPTVTSTLTLTGGQIAFPAVQVPSANVNTLDDYEEGTFTPVLTFVTPGTSSVVYSTQTGVYTKIGDLVTVCIILVTTTFTVGTAAGNVIITGLPFTVNTSTAAANRITGFNGDSAAAASTQMSFDAAAAGTTLSLLASSNNTGLQALITAATGAAGGVQKNIKLSFSYK